MFEKRKYYYVYLIFCTKGSLFGHVYIGRRISYKKPEEDVEYKGSGRRIRDYYKKYPNGYIKFILAEYDNVDNLAFGERMAITIFKNVYYEGFNNCLNIQKGGYHPFDDTNVSEEIRKKFSDNKIEYFQKHDGIWKNKNLPKEMCDKISNTMKENWQDPEYRESQCKSMKGHTPWNKGLNKETDERLKKVGENISKSNKGRTAWNKGIKMKKEDHPLYGKRKVFDNEEHTEWHWEKII